jgi:hypothetical protein
MTEERYVLFTVVVDPSSLDWNARFCDTPEELEEMTAELDALDKPYRIFGHGVAPEPV